MLRVSMVMLVVCVEHLLYNSVGGVTVHGHGSSGGVQSIVGFL